MIAVVASAHENATTLRSSRAGTSAEYVVYRLLGDEFKLLYIGCTSNIQRRLGQHRVKQPWWGEVICYSLEHYAAERAEAYAAELAAIRRERPPYCRVAERRPPAERFWEKVDIREPHECWNWTASQVSGGYGQFASESERPRTAHSFAFELTHGVRSTKSAGVRQTCGNRLCVNPAHLALGKRADARTHCKYGHEFTEANTYLPPRGSRQCRECVRAASRSYYARKALQAA